MFTFDEYKKKYSHEEPANDATDDSPDAVAAALATETVAILRKGLKEVQATHDQEAGL